MTTKTAKEWYNCGYDVDAKDKKQAYEFYKKANEADPKYANAYFGMAACQKTFKEYDNALENYDKYIK